MLTAKIYKRQITERVSLVLARMVPRWLVYWVGIRLWANATSGENDRCNASDIAMAEVLRLWSKS